MEDVLGCGGFIIAFMLASVLSWKGCACGKDKAVRDFKHDPVYADFQSASKDAEEKIAAAKSEAVAQIESAKAHVRQLERESSGMEMEVEFLESYAVPDENMKVDAAFSDGEKKEIVQEFISWAGREKSEKYGEAMDEQRKAEHFRQSADERLKTLEKSFWNKVGISKPDDKIYRDFLSKSEDAQKLHDKAIGELQEEFFKMMTNDAVEAIKLQMDGPHGDDGIRAVIGRSTKNAKRLRKEAEEALNKL